MVHRANVQYALDAEHRVQAHTVYACENVGWKQDWLSHVMKIDKIFTDAEELGSYAVAMTADSTPAIAPWVEMVSGGWICSQNSSVNPLQVELQDEVKNFAQPSGETLLYFGQTIQRHGVAWGYGENACSLVSISRIFSFVVSNWL